MGKGLRFDVASDECDEAPFLTCRGALVCLLFG